MTPQKHTIEITIDESGNLQTEVKGVDGPSCEGLSKWIDELGKLTRDEKTKDFYQTRKQQTTRTVGN